MPLTQRNADFAKPPLNVVYTPVAPFTNMV